MLLQSCRAGSGPTTSFEALVLKSLGQLPKPMAVYDILGECAPLRGLMESSVSAGYLSPQWQRWPLLYRCRAAAGCVGAGRKRRRLTCKINQTAVCAIKGCRRRSLHLLFFGAATAGAAAGSAPARCPAPERRRSSGVKAMERLRALSPWMK